MAHVSRFVLYFSILNVPLSQGYECAPGTYGKNCNMKCGHCIGGHVFCDPMDGICANGCAKGYIGLNCKEECPPGWYGRECQQKCSNMCKDPLCEPRTGACSVSGCQPGYTGHTCTQACPSSTYGDQCTEKCHCQPDCGCHPVTGTCHTDCSHNSTGQERWKREEPKKAIKIQDMETDHTASEGGKGTQMLCRQMSLKFSQLKEKLNNHVDIPLIPLLIILVITFLVCLPLALNDIWAETKRERQMSLWEMEYLDKALAESEVEEGEKEKKEEEEGEK